MFSVVIPLYNKELSIRNTIQSVLAQTCQDFEIVVVNDGSTDNSAAVVEAIEDDRIRLIHQKNQGVSAARNRGIEEARCEWIAFLDGDDLWEKAHLQEILLMMRKFPSEKVFVTSFCYSDKRSVSDHLRRPSTYIINNYFKEALAESLMWTSVVVVNKNSLVEAGMFNETLNRGEDLELWSRLAKRHSIVKSSNVTATYRIDAENRSHLKKGLEATYAYNCDLNLMDDPDEEMYHRMLILERLYAYIRWGDLKSFMVLKKRHLSISWTECIVFSLYSALRGIARRHRRPR